MHDIVVWSAVPKILQWGNAREKHYLGWGNAFEKEMGEW